MNLYSENVRDRFIELVEDGLVDPIDALKMCVKYMSIEEVEEVLDLNELSDRFLECDY
jgi:DNA-binding GntR family transcriptional regulator